MKTIADLGPQATLLAPAYLHTPLREELLQSTNGIMGLTITTLQAWLMRHVSLQLPSKEVTLYMYKESISKILDNIAIYRSLALTPAFLLECYQFLDAMTFWNVPLEELPNDTAAHRELSLILKTLAPIPTPAVKTRAALQAIQHTSCAQLYIVDAFHTLEEEAIIKQLVSQGAVILPAPHYEPQRELYYAVNKRQEIEACAQMIIERGWDGEDVAITLADASYQPILTQVFDRYQLPYTLLQDTYTSIIPHQFHALFAYYLHPGEEELNALFDHGLCPIDQLQKLRDYLAIFACAIDAPFTHLQALQAQGNIMDALEIAKLQELEVAAEQARIELLALLAPLRHPASLADLICTAVSFVQAALQQGSADTSMFLKVEEMLQECSPYLRTKEDLAFFQAFLKDMSSMTSPKQRQGVIISHLQHSIRGRRYLFLLGGTQKAYPGFTPKKGIFDETWHALLPSFPSMEERYSFYTTQMEALLDSCETTILSYPKGTYEGKSEDVALEIEELFPPKSAKPYPLAETYGKCTPSFTISPAMAEALFVHEGQIYGSISSLERYVKCPFSYFLRYGLGLREPMKVGFPNSYAGTLLHYLLETLTSQYGKDYTTLAKEDIEAILMEEIHIMQDIFPALAKKLDNVAQRILASFWETLRLLEDYEQHSRLTPSQFELPFTYDIDLREDIKLALKGFIDRIDASDEYLSILDYKSSMKRLDEKKVFAALQLQLVTYALVCAQQFDKRILGAFYVSLKQENIPYVAGSIARRQKEIHLSSRAEYEEARQKAHRFNGWVMDEHIDSMDDNARHIKSVKMNKDGLVGVKDPYDLESIQELFLSMYRQIGHRILAGDIALQPTADACRYCDYHEICRFKGAAREAEPLVDYKDQIYKNAKGSEEDA